MRVCLCFVAYASLFLSPAFAQELLPENLTGQVQDFLAQAPFTLEQFAADPFGTITTLLEKTLWAQLKTELLAYTKLLLFLTFSGMIFLYLPGLKGQSLLELIAGCGVFVLSAEALVRLSGQFLQNILTWRNYLAAFIPVFAGVVAATGQPTAAAVYSGFFLSCINLLARILQRFTQPVLAIFLAVGAAGAISESEEAAALGSVLGTGLRKLANLAALAFCAVMGVQRVFTTAADSASVQAGQLIAGAVPIVGQTLTAATQTLLAAGSVLRSGLGFSAIAVIGAEFLPLYLRCLTHMLCLQGTALLARMFDLTICRKVLDHLAQAAAVLGALAALFFVMVFSATALMFQFGKGG